MNIGRKLIRLLDSAVNFLVLSTLLILLAYGCYALWDSQQLYAAADNAQYEIFKPKGENSASFEELRAVNPEVFGWLTVYGTNIDYPLTQGQDNEKYVNTAADGTYALSGSLFLDFRNDQDFSDFNSIIYGHHMDKKAMFGEISSFRDKTFFDQHRYGRLYSGGREWGVEFCAFLEIDAYDELYIPAVPDDRQQGYLERIRSLAGNLRQEPQGEQPRLVLLSTCTTSSTNGRHVLVGWLTDTVRPDPFYQEPEETARVLPGVDEVQAPAQRLKALPKWLLAVLLAAVLLLTGGAAAGIVSHIRKTKGRR